MKHASRGFTLLEILVVVLIIAIVATFAVLSIGSRSLDDRLDLEARRLNALFGMAAEEAVQQGAELGFLQTEDGYQFLLLNPLTGIWAPVDEGAFQSRAMAEPFYLELRVDGRPVPPRGARDQGLPLAPQVMILSSGEMTAFDLEVRARSYLPYYLLQGDLVGRLRMERKAERS